MTLANKIFKIFASAGCALALFVGAAIGADSSAFFGTWVMNPAKSTFHGTPPLKSQTEVVTDAGDGMLHYVVDWVENDGKAGHVAYSIKTDGKVYPVADSTDYDGAKAVQLNSHTAKWTMLKGETVVVSGTDVVSKDKKIVTETEKGMDDGKPYSQHVVMERQ